jgi:hypothetical protein
LIPPSWQGRIIAESSSYSGSARKALCRGASRRFHITDRPGGPCRPHSIQSGSEWRAWIRAQMAAPWKPQRSESWGVAARSAHSAEGHPTRKESDPHVLNRHPRSSSSTDGSPTQTEPQVMGLGSCCKGVSREQDGLRGSPSVGIRFLSRARAEAATAASRRMPPTTASRILGSRNARTRRPGRLARLSGRRRAGRLSRATGRGPLLGQ